MLRIQQESERLSKRRKKGPGYLSSAAVKELVQASLERSNTQEDMADSEQLPAWIVKMYQEMDKKETPHHDRDDRRNLNDPYDVEVDVVDVSMSFPNPNYNGPQLINAIGMPEPSA